MGLGLNLSQHNIWEILITRLSMTILDQHCLVDLVLFKLTVSGSVMDCWKLADEGYNKIQDFAQFHHGNGTVTVKEQGFYFIYSQVIKQSKTVKIHKMTPFK